MIATLDTLPDIPSGPPDALITAAAAKLAADSRTDQFGAVRPEPALCFKAGDVIVIRDSWGDVLGQVPIREINPTSII